jgi:hypothetical protein
VVVVVVGAGGISTAGRGARGANVFPVSGGALEHAATTRAKPRIDRERRDRWGTAAA